MAKNLFVGNLDWTVTSDDLYNLFAPHGKIVLAQVMTDHATGRSRGFGFVEMQNDDEAQKAIAALHGAEFKGRPLTVNESRPRNRAGQA